MFGKILGGITDTVSDFVEDPIGTSVSMATKPVRDAADIVDGLTEGELRHKAAMSLGADLVAGMTVSELIEWYNDY